ncbi:MAG: 1-deoxy-D-xylulose-5-phosphate reductoisomerase [Alphaproteobacteria bacterium]|nr:1-deoxy-D-xylulose-5-phosphate reductoisomerase [Alphaproteobacteria bacterium]|tara:strand:+ start:16122 stop:17309 length:1188 start_codon:yes stop_codon:yes gene_type:complete
MAMTIPRTGEDTRTVTVLGSTGSVGCNTLDLIARNFDNYVVEALTANTNETLLAEQARQFRPRLTVIADETKYASLKNELSGTGLTIEAGRDALVEAARRPADWVMAAIVGAAGLKPTMAAARRGAIVALANKECLVCAGPLLMDEVRQNGATLLPVDSEHNAIFQVFDFERRDAIDRVILTASGGPFRTLDLEVMAHVTPAQAVAHPNWDMGAKISVDSATMMNKGLELIEAHQIFQFPEDRIEILIHPQSVVHSLVAYVDGSVLAQLGMPDMRTPIAYTLGWPERMPAPAARLDLAEIGQLTFEQPDSVRFPALRLARQALQDGGASPTVLNAANEVAVEGFLRSKIGFLVIAEIVEEVLTAMAGRSLQSLEDVLEIDRETRAVAEQIVRRRG